MKWRSELDLASDAASAAAQLLTGKFSANAGIASSLGKDIKTQADFQAEELIKSRLAVAGYPIIGEESAPEHAAHSGLRWLVDPLDGTINFTRGFPMFAVSIGLWDGPTPVLGVVYDLSRLILYKGCVGAGAWANDQPIRVSTVADKGQGILATGFPVGRDYGTDAVGRFIKKVQAFKKIRMIGSAALSLGAVAAGVFEAYYEEGIMIWDVAAGLALVSAAGGKVEALPGTRPHSMTVTASNGLISL